MPSRVLVDTGPLVALLSSRDQYNALCIEQLKHVALPMLTCWPVLVEAAYLLRSRPSAKHNLFHGCTNGLLRIVDIETTEIADLIELLERYDDLEPQIADVALVHLAAREGIRQIFTLDRRDFLVYRNRDGQPFELLPDMPR